MVIVNGKNIPVYATDSREDVLLRIASELDTLPEYLDFPVIPPVNAMVKDPRMKIVVYDYIDLAKKDSKNISFDSFYRSISDKFKDLSTLSKIKLWLSYNNTVTDPFNFMVADLEIKSITTDIDADSFLRNEKERFLKSISDKVKYQNQTVAQKKKISQDFDKLLSVKHTDFEIDSIIFNISTDYNKEPIEFFDRLKLSNSIPFASIKDFYKIADDFIPPKSWASAALEDVVLFKFLTKTKLKVREIYTLSDMYSDFLAFNEEGEQTISLQIRVESKTTSEQRQAYIDKILSSIEDDNINVTNVKQTAVAGLIFIPDFKINRYVFSDMALNDPIISYYIGIDESMKASKKKSSIYFYFSDPSFPEYGQISVSLTNKIAEKKDVEIRQFSRDDFGYGSNFLRIKITKAKSSESVEHFMKIFSKLLSRYSNSYNDVVNFYRIYIPNFGKEEDKKSKQEKLGLKDIAGDLFIKNYARICLKKPDIIQEKDIEKWEKEGRNVIQFPKTPEEGEQRYYVCKNDTHKFVGVRKNNLENKDIYPYVPCCFKLDQRKRKVSDYKEYYLGESKQEGEQQRMLITNKFVGLDGFAVLPKNLTDLFLELDHKYTYIRKGVTRSKSSLLECVLEVILPNVADKVEDYRQLLSKKAFLAKQNLYDKSISDISELIKNPDIYLDPRLFLSLLSSYFKCNIYCFSRKRDSEDAEFLVQRNIYGLYQKYETSSKNIIVYEHYGNESDRAEYPQCELIVRWDRTKPEPEYEHTDKIQNVYISSFNQYNKNTNVVLPLEGIKSQFIDGFGKSIFLEIDSGYFVMTSPISVLDVEVKDNIIRREYELDTAIDSARRHGITISRVCTDKSNRIIELEGSIGNVTIYFPIVPVNRLLQLPEYKLQKFLEMKDRTLNEFKYNKKMSLCLKESFLFLYSKFLKDNNLTPKVDNIPRFVNEKIRLDEGYLYRDYPSIYINDLITNGKITINSMEILKRLIFELRLYMNRDIKGLLEYHSKTKIKGYYEDISDFQKRSGEILIKGSDTIYNWSLVNISNFRVYSEIQPEMFTYFYKNYDMLGSNDLYVAYTFESLQEGFLKLYNMTDISPEFTLVSNYKRYLVKGQKTKDNITVIGYKYDDKSMFTFVIPY